MQQIHMASNEVLVVVDMQPYFAASRKPSVIEANVNLVRRFRRMNRPIAIVEYYGGGDYLEDGDGDTHRPIMKELDGYSRFGVLWKNDDDGSSVVQDWLSEMKIIPSKFWVTGVNGCWCVASTAEGLELRYPDVVVRYVKKAINCSCSSGCEYQRRAA